MKKLRKDYGFPYSLLKNAQQLFVKGTESWEACLSQAVIDYAASRQHRSLHAKAYGVAVQGYKSLSVDNRPSQYFKRVAVIELKTETASTAQNPDFINHANKLAKLVAEAGNTMVLEVCIKCLSALYGERIALGAVKTIDNVKEKVGVYNHRGRYVSVLMYRTPISKDERLPAKVKIVAQNALGYYAEFSELVRIRAKTNSLPNFKYFLKRKPVQGRPMYTPDYMEQYLKLLPKIEIVDMYMFGF